MTWTQEQIDEAAAKARAAYVSGNANKSSPWCNLLDADKQYWRNVVLAAQMPIAEVTSEEWLSTEYFHGSVCDECLSTIVGLTQRAETAEAATVTLKAALQREEAEKYKGLAIEDELRATLAEREKEIEQMRAFHRLSVNVNVDLRSRLATARGIAFESCDSPFGLADQVRRLRAALAATEDK